jgi:hypothetical protein
MENFRPHYSLLPAVDCYETDQEFDEMFKKGFGKLPEVAILVL